MSGSPVRRIVRRSPTPGWTRFHYLLFILAAFLCCRIGWTSYAWIIRDTTVPRLTEDTYLVTNVLSATDLSLSPTTAQASPNFHSRARVRLAGLTIPDQAPPEMANGATRYLRERLLKRPSQVHVRLGRRQMDDDGILLAYLYLEERLLNEELVQAGWCLTAPHPDESPDLARRLRQAQERARQEKLGYWADE